ncbi:MAG: hypothetical protein WDO14_17240 [Bacteroidota bacterium]
MRIMSIPMGRRSIACLFILVIVQSIFQPTITYALTTGPHQQEYTSYESPGSTDMVNLSTGDFTFSLPLVEVPGPEGSFSLPLTYNAGIGTEQEASWVGLGWTMNAGAITRNINQFPDDANGEANVVTVQDLVGLKGWEANTLAFGKFGWNSQVGHFGSLSILGIVNSSWDANTTSVGLAGINVTNHGMKADAAQMAIAFASILTLGAAGLEGQALAAGASPTLKTAAVIKSAATQMAVDAGIGAFSSAVSGNSITAPASGYWQYATKEHNYIVYKNYRVSLDKTRTENMYGLMYLGNAPTETFVLGGLDQNMSLGMTNGGVAETLKRFQLSTDAANKGSASDINYQPDTNEELKEFYEVNNPVILAPDNFSVKAAGVSGSIAPYRLEIGTVSMPREMSAGHERLAPVPYFNSSTYKVPFKYNGQFANSYFHHVGSASSVTTPTPYFGISTSLNSVSGQNDRMDYVLTDVIFKNDRIKSTIPATKKIPAGNDVDWLTNSEIRDGITYTSRFMDYLSGGSTVSTGSARYLFRDNLPIGKQNVFTSTASIGATIPIYSGDISKFTVNTSVDMYISIYNNANDRDNGITANYVGLTNINVDTVGTSSIKINNSGLLPYYGKYADIQLRLNGATTTKSPTSIGGFCITAANGTTYHFALPVYDYDMITETREVANPTARRSLIKRPAAFANTWLLTGITGADFVDRNQNGMIDDTDWGYFVKFNYGLHVNDFWYRMPYAGYQKLSGDTHETYTEGKKQMYYLNSVETRSHVALFIKNDRTDGKDFNYVHTPLRLDEIALIKKEKYKNLITPTGSGGYGLPDYSGSTSAMLKMSTLTGANAYNFIKLNCEKRLKFTTTYDLAQGTSNSSSGKLTLTRLSLLGRNDLPIMPDYKFEYGFNPNYNSNYWDEWGAYNPSGTSSSFSHIPTSSDQDASAWSLTKVTNPLGSEIRIAYEKDEYTTISGQKLIGDGVDFDNSGMRKYLSMLPIKHLYVTHNGFFSAGDQIRLTLQAYYKCGTASYQNKSVNQDFTIATVGTEMVDINGVQVSKQYIDLNTDYMGLGTCALVNSTDYIQFDSQSGSVMKILPSTKGGDLRVGSITMHDDFNVDQKIRYLYSGGVISISPAYGSAGATGLDFPSGYPQTSVIYGIVKVLTGKLTSDSDWDTRQTYQFETPSTSHYTLTRNIFADDEEKKKYTVTIPGTPPTHIDYYDRFNMYENKFIDKSARIGRLLSTSIEGDGSAETTTMYYNDNNEAILNDGVDQLQGVYSGGVLMFDRVRKDALTEVHKISRTTSLSYPNVLLKTVTTKDGYTTQTENKDWDFLTGQVLQTLSKSDNGMYVKSIIKPAYRAYSELGSKANMATNKNMLNQVAATYVYRSNANGDKLGLLSASAKTWKKDWNNYRKYNSTTGLFEDGTEDADVWRVYESWSNMGQYADRQDDGSFKITTDNEFNFSGSNTRWTMTGRTDRYDHYSMPLASRNINGLYSASKMGYDNRVVIASASNANYQEIAFSSAEDLNGTNSYFGGEVALGNGLVKYKSKGDPVTPHTGDAVVDLASGVTFVYKPLASQLTPNRTYRASVWTNTTDGQIYYKLNGGTTVTSGTVPGKKAGDWYQVNITIPISGTPTSLEVGVKTAGAESLFDDFRFQPLDASMTCHVPSPPDFTITTGGLSLFDYTIDNDNMFIKNEYNERGQLIKIYRESFKYGVTLITESKDNYRRFHFNQ